MKNIYTKIIGILLLTGITKVYPGDFSIGPRMITQKNVWSEQALLLHVALNNGDLTTLFNGLAYGLTENIGLQLTIPVVLHEKINKQSNKGLGNLLLMGQWQFYKQPANLGIIYAGVRVPTRTLPRSVADTSGGVASYFFDIAGIHSSQNWYAQTRAIVLTTPKSKNLKPGDVFFYVLSAGPKINCRNSSLFTLLALRGIHAQDNRVNNVRVNTGGMVIFLGPQFGLKRKNLTVGSAFGFPIMQRIQRPLPQFEWFGALLFQVDF